MQIWICNPWASYMRQLELDNDREWLEHEKAEDLEHEEQLARDHVEDMCDGFVDEDDWPDYADLPSSVIEPEIIDDAVAAIESGVMIANTASSDDDLHDDEVDYDAY